MEENYYGERSQTRFSPSIYERYYGSALVQMEKIDFQTHLYQFGEMEQILQEIGFTNARIYSSFSKDNASGNEDKMFLFVCAVD